MAQMTYQEIPDLKLHMVLISCPKKYLRLVRLPDLLPLINWKKSRRLVKKNIQRIESTLQTSHSAHTLVIWTWCGSMIVEMLMKHVLTVCGKSTKNKNIFWNKKKNTLYIKNQPLLSDPKRSFERLGSLRNGWFFLFPSKTTLPTMQHFNVYSCIFIYWLQRQQNRMVDASPWWRSRSLLLVTVDGVIHWFTRRWRD